MTRTPLVVASYGKGADSMALVLRWINEPGTRPGSLRNLLVVTVRTGDEWPITGQLVTRHSTASAGRSRTLPRYY
jgi:hypothetical protein